MRVPPEDPLNYLQVEGGAPPAPHLQSLVQKTLKHLCQHIQMYAMQRPFSWWQDAHGTMSERQTYLDSKNISSGEEMAVQKLSGAQDSVEAVRLISQNLNTLPFFS